MSAELYGSVNGANRKVKKLYADVNGVTREIKEVYANVNGVTRKVYSGKPTLTLRSYKTEGNLVENNIDFRVSSSISGGNYIINFKFVYKGDDMYFPDHELRCVLVIEGLDETQYYYQDSSFLTFPSDILLNSDITGGGEHQFKFSVYGDEDKIHTFISTEKSLTRDADHETLSLNLLYDEYTNSYPYKRLYLDFYDRYCYIYSHETHTLKVTIPAGMKLKYSETGEMLPIKYEY